jgi:hypothetical protein
VTGTLKHNRRFRVKAEEKMFATCQRIYAWLEERARVVVFRFKRGRAIRKGRREDNNRYPLW